MLSVYCEPVSVLLRLITRIGRLTTPFRELHPRLHLSAGRARLMERKESQFDCCGDSRVRVVDFGAPSVQVEPVEGVSIRGVCALFGEVF